ncbi:hypothetical protein HK102_013553 [Quaeritorhiza haematococci]|nr:hypothetical protein HK102_013553 [Quaeritorhiza haematococci]
MLKSLTVVMLCFAVLWAARAPAAPTSGLTERDHHTLAKRASTSDPFVAHEIDIDVPVEFLWQFLGNNTNAHRWSSFFDHISDLPANLERNNREIGVGKRRRCYRTAEEKGYYWDEETVHVIPHRLRRIYTFNFVTGSWMDRIFNVDTYTDNIFVSLSPTQTRFKFETYIIHPRMFQWGWLRWMWQNASGRKMTLDIFRINQENIKAMAEAVYNNREYIRPHPWTDEWPMGDQTKQAPPNTDLNPEGPSYNDHEKLLKVFPPRI